MWRVGPIWFALLVSGAAFATPSLLPAQDYSCGRGDVEVRGMRFTGNESFSALELANGIVTTPSAWARRTFRVFGTRRCLDRTELRLDVARLQLFYRRHGFYQIQVDTTVRPVGDDGVRITFAIEEGEPLLADTVHITGLDSVPTPGRVTAALPIAAGRRFDQYWIDSARVLVTQRLRDAGYPVAEVADNSVRDTLHGGSRVELDVSTGPRTTIGELAVVVLPREGAEQEISDSYVRRLTGLRSGQLYRERDMVNAQRRLYQSDAYAHAEVSIDSLSRAAGSDAAANVLVRVRETEMQTVRAGLGYGTLDCVRASAEYTDVNVGGSTRRLGLTGRVSKIGIGAPLDVARDLCLRDVRSDVYSDTLNYYMGATLTQLPLRGILTLPSVTLYSERRSEFNAYLRTTPAALALSRTWARGLGIPVTGTYILEYGRTEAQPALLCAVFSLCTDEDRARVQENQRLGVFSAAITRDRTNDLVNPTRGSVLRLDARHSSRITGSGRDQGFNQLLGTASWYRGIAGGAVIAARVRAGAVLGESFSLASNSRFVPPQERLYAGGPTTVRGFRQNELGPVVYLANQFADTTITVNGNPVRVFVADPADGFERAVPTGGNSVVVGNLELRFPSPMLPELFQLTLFTDVGEVWNRDARSNLGFRSLKWTPGIGVRARSPVGPIRVDLGYNPYALPAGGAYFDAPLRENASLAPLYCVSPGNSIPVSDIDDGGVTVPVQQPGASCAATFQPEAPRGFLRRLTVNFSIGQAF